MAWSLSTSHAYQSLRTCRSPEKASAVTGYAISPRVSSREDDTEYRLILLYRLEADPGPRSHSRGAVRRGVTSTTEHVANLAIPHPSQVPESWWFRTPSRAAVPADSTDGGELASQPSTILADRKPRRHPPPGRGRPLPPQGPTPQRQPARHHHLRGVSPQVDACTRGARAVRGRHAGDRPSSSTCADARLHGPPGSLSRRRHKTYANPFSSPTISLTHETENAPCHGNHSRVTQNRTRPSR